MIEYGPNSIVVIGGGGHAKVVIELLQSLGTFAIAGCLDGGKLGQLVLGVPVIGDDAALEGLFAAGIRSVALGIGDNILRESIAQRAVSLGFALPPLLSPFSYVAQSATIGPGTAVFPRAVIHTSATIGDYCIINTGAIVEHDCIVGQAVHIAPGSVLCGRVCIGARTLIGANATVIPQTSIGTGTIIGAGSVVIRSLKAPGTYAGAPAQLLD